MRIIRLSGRVVERIKIFLILAFVYSLLLYATPLCAQKDFSALYKKVAPAVVRINVFDKEGNLTKYGTGFFIREDGLVATNYHVIEGSVEAEVRLSDGTTLPMERIAAKDREGDLVFLKLRAEKRSFPTLKFTDTKIETGQAVVVIGSPLGFEGSISDGIISSIRETPDLGKVVQITAPVSPGSSGSPVLNMKGEVVGVATALVRGGQNLNFAIPVESLNRLLSRLDKRVNRLSAIEWLEKGLALMESGKYQDAIEAYSEAIELNPNYVKAYNNRGVAYRNLGEYQQAMRDYGRAIEIDPNYVEAYNNRGIAYAKLGDYRQAIRDYDRAIELNPENALVYCNRGIAYDKLGDYRQSIRDYDKTIELDPKFALAYYNRGISYGKLGDSYRETMDSKTAAKLGYKPAQDYLKSEGIDLTDQANDAPDTENKPEIVYLACTIEFNEKKGIVKRELDYQNKTVNGHSACFSKGEIRWAETYAGIQGYFIHTIDYAHPGLGFLRIDLGDKSFYGECIRAKVAKE